MKPQGSNISSGVPAASRKTLTSTRGGGSISAPLPILPGIAIIGLLVRLMPLLYSIAMDPDSPRYIELAERLHYGCGFARLIDGKCAAPETLLTPGYPFFLAGMPNLQTAVALQGIIGAAVCLLIALFVRRCWGLRAAITAELILVFDVPSILIGITVMSDIVFQALIAAGVVMLLWVISRERGDRIAITTVVVAALVFGVAILVRPLGIVLTVFAAFPVLLLPKISWRRSLPVALLAFLIPSSVAFGWMARNAYRTGVWTLSTDGPIDLYYFKAAGVIWYRGDQSFQSVQDDLGRQLGWPQQYYTDVPPSLQPVMMRRAKHILMSDPAGTMIMTLRCLGWLAVVPVRGSLNEYLGANAAPVPTLQPLET